MKNSRLNLSIHEIAFEIVHSIRPCKIIIIIIILIKQNNLDSPRSYIILVGLILIHNKFSVEKCYITACLGKKQKS